jgi:hypothetical protein
MHQPLPKNELPSVVSLMQWGETTINKPNTFHETS